jgi:hypothetical protein
MLSPLDDFPVHQVAESMSVVGTSDRNFYDRYYFNGFDHTGETMFVVGHGQYPNLGVTDAFLLVRRGPHHRAVRASRELRQNRLDTQVGPIRIEVIEPLKKLRVICEPNEHGLAIDAVWTGAIPAIEEPRHYIREHGRVIFDTVRLAQTGGWDGTLVVDGEELTLTDATHWGTRDRSWGIRPVGESEPPGVRASTPFGWFWIYTPIRFADHSILIIQQERPDGSKVMEEAIRVWPDGRQEWLGAPTHEMTFQPGTRNATSAIIRAGDTEIRVEPLLPVHIGIGTGYGYETDWKHGMWQGSDLVVQGVHHDVSTPEGAARMWGIVDASARFTYDGNVGYGLFETLLMGPHQQYGFTDIMDGWQPA